MQTLDVFYSLNSRMRMMKIQGVNRPAASLQDNRLFRYSKTMRNSR